MARLDKLAAALEIEYLRHGAPAIANTLNGTSVDGAIVACSVVNDEGVCLAHTDPTLVGRPPTEVASAHFDWRDISGVRYVDDAGRGICEYRTTLTAGNERIGELRMAIAEPNVRETFRQSAKESPWTLIAPLAVVAYGGGVLRRLVRGPASLELQLRRIARTSLCDDVSLELCEPRDALGVGWNRVAETLDAMRQRVAEGGEGRFVAAAATAREEGWFKEILQRLSEGVAVTDAEGRIEFANQAVAALLRASDDASPLEGASWTEQLTTGALAVSDRELLVDGSSSRQGVCEVQHAEGDLRRVYRVARRPLDGSNEGRSVWTVRDVTQNKLAEQSRDQFIDTATHELRTPLANIKAYAETLATTDSINVERQKEFCNIINAEVTRLARFVDDLLSISSMEVGSLTADLRPVELTRLFDEATAKVQPVMASKQIHFAVSLPAKLPGVSVDKDKLVAVLVNLLGNAAKYTPAQGRVELNANVEGGLLRIVVKDSGVGIAPNELPHVFEKFFRSSDPRVQSETGTGLGLSLAREVMRMHNGEITAESELGVGSTFTATLPIA